MDVHAGTVYRFHFTTKVGNDGATLGGSPVISIYKDANVAQVSSPASGITLTPDFDGVVGWNLVEIDTSADATFYTVGSCFSVVLTTGSVAGISITPFFLRDFSIDSQYVSVLANGIHDAAFHLDSAKYQMKL